MLPLQRPRVWFRDVGFLASLVYTGTLLIFNLANNSALGQVTGALVAGPLIAAILADRRRRVVIAGVLAFLAAVISGIANEVALDASQWMRLALIIVCTVLGYVGADIRLRQRTSLATMEEVAKTAQLAIMAKQVPPDLPRVEVAFRYLAASQQAMIGGDAYESLVTSFGLRILVADAMGKGLDAVRSAALTLGAFRELAHQEEDLAQLLIRLDHSVRRDSPAHTFTTALIAQLHEETLTFVLAGHPAPIRVRAGEAQQLDIPPEPPLSLLPSRASPNVGRVVIHPGDTVFMFSDGLTEARGPRGEFYPLHEVIEKKFADPAELEGCVDELIDDLRQHVQGHLSDDLVLVILHRKED